MSRFRFQIKRVIAATERIRPRSRSILGPTRYSTTPRRTKYDLILNLSCASKSTMSVRAPTKSSSCDNDDIAKCQRKWTPTQIQRKRALDRQAQRASREKTKNRIAHLEALVESFQSNCNDNDRVNELLKTISEQRTEIERLRVVIRGISRLIEDTDITPESSHTAIESDSLPANELTSNSPDGEPCNDEFDGVLQKHCSSIPIGVEAMHFQHLPLDESVVLEDIISPIVE